VIKVFGTNFTLFSVSLPKNKVTNSAYTAVGCKAYIRDKNDKHSAAYSEMEEIGFSSLNSNDYGTCCMDVEFCFDNNQPEPYQYFYAG
jgi:hypothetical protein